MQMRIILIYGVNHVMQTHPNPVRSDASTAPQTEAVQATPRVNSAVLMQGRKELEIEHGGKIYRLRVTQLNKLILTA